MFVVIYCSDHKQSNTISNKVLFAIGEKRKKKKNNSVFLYVLSFFLSAYTYILTQTHLLFTVILARVFDNDVI